MCLAVPGKIVAVSDEDGIRMGRVELGGITRSVCLEHVRSAVVGDYVLVHVGFALARIDAAEAERTFALLRELGALDEALEDALDKEGVS